MSQSMTDGLAGDRNLYDYIYILKDCILITLFLLYFFKCYVMFIGVWYRLLYSIFYDILLKLTKRLEAMM